VWRDDAGRPIKRLDGDGRLWLTTFDDEGRVVRIDLAHGRFDAGKAERREICGITATHCFRYDAEGRLVEETDCVAKSHKFEDANAQVDPKTGSAMKGHNHK